MNTIKYIFAVLFFTMLNSCGDTFSTVIEIDPPEFESKMTFTTYITAGDTIVEMFIGKNRSILEGGELEDYNLDNAKVTIVKPSEGLQLDTDNNPQTTFNSAYNYGIKLPDASFFSPGETYIFRVEHPDFTTSETELVFPEEDAVLENFTYKREDGLDEEFDESSSISFDIVDRAGKDGFYELSATTINGFFGENSFWISTLDPIGTKGSPNDNLFFADETFDGERKRITIKFDRYLYEPEQNSYVELTWSNVNEGHYTYSRAISRYSNADGVPFLSPVQVTSNVNNALGNISLKTETKYQVK